MVCEEDPHGFLEAVGDFLSGRIDLVQNVDQHVQSRGGLSLRHVVVDLFDRLQDHSLTIAGHVGKQAVLDGIVLGGVGRIVGHTNLQAHALGEILQPLFEQIA